MLLVVVVVLVCTFMAAITYGLGILPLHLDVKQNLRSISLFSGGLLIGAALCLAIPESIEIYNDTGNDTKWIGISIMLGFVCMVVTEQLSGDSHNENLDFGPVHHTGLVKSILDSSLTVGLIIHGAMDGISLGSAFHNEDITFVLSMVVIIHKLPTCFSLGCLLLQKGFSNDLVRNHILVFSLTTPVFAFSTWLVLLVTKSSDMVIGLLLLFSSGTFIYVLTHILSDFKDLNGKEIGILLMGIIIPALLGFMH